MSDFDWLLRDPEGAERLAALRRQRMLLAGLRDDVAEAQRGLSGPGPGDAWESNAQRAYMDRRAELHRDLGLAERFLDEALSELHAAIARGADA